MKDVVDYSIGFSKDEVVGILGVQKEELLNTLQAYTNDGSSVNKRRLDEIHAIIRACQDALIKLDPQTYKAGRRVAQAGFTGYLEK